MLTEDDKKRKIDEQKRMFDAVTKAWLDDKFASFGRWTFKAIMAVIFILILRAIVHMNSSDLRAVLATAEQVHQLVQ